jgi:ABC-2 type transport system permease protein
MHAVFTLALKDILQLWRNKFGLFWVIAFPLLMALFFGSIFSGGGSAVRTMKIAFIENQSSDAQAFLAELQRSEVLDIRPMSLDSARASVARGRLTAYIQFIQADARQASVWSPSKDSIQVGIDPSRKAEAGYLQGLISQAYFARISRKFTDPQEFRKEMNRSLESMDSAYGLSAEQKGLLRGAFTQLDTFMSSVNAADSASAHAGNPFGSLNLSFTDVANVTVGPRSSWEITFPQSLLWALIGCAATFALSIVMERTHGTYLRLRLAPISRLQILAGKGLACFLSCVFVCTTLMAFGAIVFHVKISSVVLMSLAIISAAFCFVGMMMLISVLGKSERTVMGSGWSILLIFSMIGGGMVPLMFMPPWIASLSNLSPMKWCVLAFEGAIWRGFAFADMILPLAILWSIGFVGFFIGTIVLIKSES